MRTHYYKVFFTGILKVLLWIWQLPQNLAGLVSIWIFHGILYHQGWNGDTYWSTYLPGGGAVCLGEYILISPSMRNISDVLKHESGHRIQSRILGPLYLPEIGVRSFLWAITHKLLRLKIDYYWFPTERWADWLAGRIK